jgi:peptidoglycan/xylan/chitin deacetylase (PgdA/CDA1 family)
LGTGSLAQIKLTLFPKHVTSYQPHKILPKSEDIILMIALGIIIFWLIPFIAASWFLYIIYLEYRQDRVPILLYHRLLSKKAADRGEVRDDEMIYVCYDVSFAEQMEYLHDAGYNTLDFDDYLSIREGKIPFPEKPVIITFDDGYLSTYTMAFPVLKKYGFKATQFVVLEPNEYSLRCVEGMDSFLTRAQISEMVNHKISIQSHTLTHCVLSSLADNEILYELMESRRQISAITGRSVDHIAIPRAGYGRRVQNLVKKVGYKSACCNNKGTANNKTDLLALPRIVIERDMDLKDFTRCLTPKTSIMLRIVGNIKRIPERIVGPQLAKKIRDVLYSGSFRYLFELRTLKILVPIFGVLYAFSSVFFTWNLITR